MIARYKNDSGKFKVCDKRARVLFWLSHGQEDVLRFTDEEFISLDKPIRSGIPLCWPWFAKGEYGDLTPSRALAWVAG